MNRPDERLKTEPHGAMRCLYLELENTAADPSKGLDFDPQEIVEFVRAAQAKLPKQALDLSRGLFLQIDELPALMNGAFAQVRQTVCIPLAPGAAVPACFDTGTFPKAHVLSFAATGDLGAALADGVKRARAWQDPTRGRLIGSFARLLIRPAGPGKSRATVLIETTAAA